MELQGSMFERRLQEILAMPDGPEKENELRQLSLDYPGRLEDLAKQQAFSQELSTQGMPHGQVAGSASNPFSVYVGANPLEFAAAGVEKYMGHKQNRDIQQQMTKLREQGEGQNQKLLEAGLAAQQAQAGALRQGILTPDAQREWLEEEERLRRLGLIRR